MLRAHHSIHSIAQLIFFFNDTATTEIYTLPLHDALPISLGGAFTRVAEFSLHLLNLLAKLLVLRSGLTQRADVSEPTADPIDCAGGAALDGIHDGLRD